MWNGFYRRNGSDEHDGTRRCTFSGVIRRQSGDDPSYDPTDVEQDRKVSRVLWVDVDACKIWNSSWCNKSLLWLLWAKLYLITITEL